MPAAHRISVCELFRPSCAPCQTALCVGGSRSRRNRYRTLPCFFVLACLLCLSHFCTHLWWPIIGGPWDRRPRDMEICASYRRSPKILKSHTRAAHSLGAHVGGHLAIRCEAGNHSCDRFFWLCTANTQNKNKRKATQGLGDPHALSTRSPEREGTCETHQQPCEPAWPVPIEAERIRIPR